VAIAGSVLLWFAGAIFFDAVHVVLHRMLRSRWRVLRLLAWPHAVHHEWLDRTLTLRWENQRRNVWCHLVPEFLTQLAFSGTLFALAPVAMRPAVLGCVALQVLVFCILLSYRGRDVNHRPIAVLDAYTPSFVCYPAYHALHHVYPDAYFSAYGKLVDWAVGGGACLRGRRFALCGGETAFGRALRAALVDEGVAGVEPGEPTSDRALAGTDVLVLCDPGPSETVRVERFIEATRARQLPPEVWAVHAQAEDAVARHYYDDVRVIYRTIVLPEAGTPNEATARRRARIALFFIRRGLHFVPTTWSPAMRRAFRRFRRTMPTRPAAPWAVASRAQLVA
jgi:hypothetical protein